MKIDLGSSVVILTITEEDLIPMLKEYIQQKLGAGTVKVDMCLNEPCRAEFTPALQPTQSHRSMMAAAKKPEPDPQDYGGWRRW